MKFNKKQKVIALTTAAVVATGGGVAWAYFTTTGTGAGTAAVGTSSPLTITQDAFGGTGAPVVSLLPGGPAQYIGFKINNTTDGYQYVAKVTVSIPTFAATGDVVSATDGQIAGCKAAWFTLNGGVGGASADVATATQIAPQAVGAYPYVAAVVTPVTPASAPIKLTLANSNVTQDACKMAIPKLVYTGSAA
jgi:hypothetical protein